MKKLGTVILYLLAWSFVFGLIFYGYSATKNVKITVESPCK
jgi:hypothetical protein